MMRLYVMPKRGDGLSLTTVFAPKYIDATIAIWRGMDYGLEDAFLVAADVTPAQHAAIAANADVLSAPADLTTTVTVGALSVMQAQLDAWNLPNDWITVGMTYRQILGGLIRVVLLMQRFHGQTGRLFSSGITLTTTIASLSPATRTKLSTAAQSLGLNISGITLSMTVSEALMSLAIQWGSIGIGGVTL